VLTFLGSIDVSACAMPPLSRLEDCKVALICLNEFGPVANWDKNVFLPLLKLLVEDGGRLVIACDIHRLIASKLDRERYGAEQRAAEQRAVYKKLRSNLIDPRLRRFRFRFVFVLELVLVGFILLHYDLDGLPSWVFLIVAILFFLIMYYGIRSRPRRLGVFFQKCLLYGLALVLYSMVIFRMGAGSWGRSD